MQHICTGARTSTRTLSKSQRLVWPFWCRLTHRIESFLMCLLSCLIFSCEGSSCAFAYVWHGLTCEDASHENMKPAPHMRIYHASRMHILMWEKFLNLCIYVAWRHMRICLTWEYEARASHVNIHRKSSLYLPLGSVNLVWKAMGTPEEISSPPGWNRVLPGCPRNFNTKLTEPTRQINTTFPMNMPCLTIA